MWAPSTPAKNPNDVTGLDRGFEILPSTVYDRTRNLYTSKSLEGNWLEERASKASGTAAGMRQFSLLQAQRLTRKEETDINWIHPVRFAGTGNGLESLCRVARYDLGRTTTTPGAPARPPSERFATTTRDSFSREGWLAEDLAAAPAGKHSGRQLLLSTGSLADRAAATEPPNRERSKQWRSTQAASDSTARVPGKGSGLRSADEPLVAERRPTYERAINNRVALFPQLGPETMEKPLRTGDFRRMKEKFDFQPATLPPRPKSRDSSFTNHSYMHDDPRVFQDTKFWPARPAKSLVGERRQSLGDYAAESSLFGVTKW